MFATLYKQFERFNSGKKRLWRSGLLFADRNHGYTKSSPLPSFRRLTDRQEKKNTHKKPSRISWKQTPIAFLGAIDQPIEQPTIIQNIYARRCLMPTSITAAMIDEEQLKCIIMEDD